MHLKSLFAVASLLVTTVCGDYISYPRPDTYVKSPHFSLKVNGTYMYTVNYDGYDYVQLSMDEGHDTEFRIKVTEQDSIDNYRISPGQLPIEARIDGNELIFSLKKAHYLIVKIDKQKEFVILIDPTETDVPASSGSNIYNVLDYNADNTGGTVTKGIQSAMDAAAEHPGSIVYVPPGLYNIGNLMIRDKTALYLAGGSVLRFTGNPEDYNTMFYKSDLKLDGTWWIQTEFDSTNIKVYGRGTIDGNGKETRANKFMADLLVPAGTKNFLCDGILVRDSAFWAVVPVQVEDALFTNLKILDRFTISQNDGIDVVESQRVTVRRAIAISNDDSFSTKTWPYDVGTTVPYPYKPRPQNDIIFEDCLAWTHCYGFKVGQGVWETQDNVQFLNSAIYHAGVGLGIHHLFGSATASNIRFENIDIEDLGGAPGGQGGWFVALVQNHNGDAGHRGVGPIEGVYVHNIQARDLGDRISRVQGYDDTSIVSRVTFRDVYVKGGSSPATTLEQLNIQNTDWSKNVRIDNYH